MSNLTVSTAVDTFMQADDEQGERDALQLGTIATQDADAVDITNGSIIVSNLTTGNATISGGTVTATLAGDGSAITIKSGAFAITDLFDNAGNALQAISAGFAAGASSAYGLSSGATFSTDGTDWTSSGAITSTALFTGIIAAAGGAITIGSDTGVAASIDSDGTAVFGSLTATSFTGDGSGITGVPIAGVTGLASGVDTFLGAPTSANLRSAMTSAGPSNVTGSGALVYASSPVLVTPTLGTPSSGTLTSCTGYTTANLSGTITNAQLAGSITAAKLVGTDIATVGTLTAGATGAGFTVALTTSTITGSLPDARNTVSNSTTTTLSAVTSLTAANSITIGPASGTSKTLTVQTTTSGGAAATAATFNADQTTTFAAGVFQTSNANSSTQNFSARNSNAGASAISRYDVFNNNGAVSATNGASFFLCSSATAGGFANAMGFWNYENGPIVMAANSVERMRIHANGGVSIGNTTSPGAGLLSVTGGITTAGSLAVASGTATPAGGSTSARLVFGTTSGFGIYFGSGAPTVSAGKGSLYLRSDGSGSNDRAYVNTDGSTTWTPMVTVG